MLAVLALILSFLRPAEPQPIAIVHVNVVDTEGGRSLPGRTVLIAGGKIAAVAPDGVRHPDPEGTKILDGSGKTLIPGLWDMHVHLKRESSLAPEPRQRRDGRPRHVGQPGGVRAGRSAQLMAVATSRTGRGVGPRMVVASNILDGPKPIWPGSVAIRDAEGHPEGRPEGEVGRGRLREGLLAPLRPNRSCAIAEESKAQGLPFAGHVPHPRLGRRGVGPRDEEHGAPRRAPRRLLDEGRRVDSRPSRRPSTRPRATGPPRGPKFRTIDEAILHLAE